ncbi:MAG: SLC13 family permease [Burkholderiaceae bacterium]|nr:SLC13 family permease [Burkholderiaceae bacterium]
MSAAQWTILAILAATVAMFVWGRWRHDMVAMAALLACVLAGLLPASSAFTGFGHPAVITVACVLVLSRGLQTSGLVDLLARRVLPAKAGVGSSLVALIGLGALLSGFMNNVGAMALLMPVAVRLAERLQLAPGQVLMPLAFGTILGGMTTLIGTPPNLIVAGFRQEQGMGSFGMFDFTPVGLSVALAGVLLIAFIGWRLVPVRKQAGMEGFDTGAYLTEVRVPKGSSSVGQTLNALETALDKAGAQVVGLVRNEVRVLAPSPWRHVVADDILVIEADAEALPQLLAVLELRLEESRRPEEEEKAEPEAEARDASAGNAAQPEGASAPQAAEPVGTAAPPDEAADQDEEAAPTAESSRDKSDIRLVELVIRPGSGLEGRSASDLLLRTRYGLNLLAVSRQGQRARTRLRAMPLHAGDLLLMQGPFETIAEFASDNGCVPLAERKLHIPSQRKAWQAGSIMVAAVAAAALGWLPAAIAFAMAVLASMALRTVSPRAVYEAVDWPVVVLLAALMPVAGAMETTGTANLIARFMLDHLAQGHAVLGLGLILVVTMFLSDLMNNAATAAVMCPIALGTASALGASADPFLMAVAIGASCAFLTPIGHQNNTLILGPGGFRFGDYWRLGLPLEVLVVAISMPVLLMVWPL